MEYEVLQDEDHPERWIASAVDFEHDGEIFTVLFIGRNAEQLAHEYADWKNLAGASSKDRAA